MCCVFSGAGRAVDTPERLSWTDRRSVRSSTYPGPRLRAICAGHQFHIAASVPALAGPQHTRAWAPAPMGPGRGTGFAGPREMLLV